jgi:membrane protease YdiL (CAAX protease family)
MLLAILLALLHEILVTRFWWSLPFAAAEGEWNWGGKLLALAATIMVASTPAFGWRRTGLTLHQAPGSWHAWVLAFAIILYACARSAFVSDGQPVDRNTMAFLWTMPGLEEEIFFRGVLLVAMNEAFASRRRVMGAELGWGAVLTPILFGAGHGVSYSDGNVALALGPVLWTFVLGLLLVWVRERTGSLLAPILCHCALGGFRTLF